MGEKSSSQAFKGKKLFPLLFVLKFSYTDSSITHLKVGVSQGVILDRFLILHTPLG